MRDRLSLILVFLLSSHVGSSAAEISGGNQQSLLRNLQDESCPPEAQTGPGTRCDRSQAHDNAGAELIRVGEAQKDNVVLPSYLDHGPEHPYTYYNLAQAHCGSGQNLQAIFNLSLALERDPNFQAAYHFRGLLHFQDREFESALADLNQALELYPDNSHAELYRDRARLCLRGKYHCDQMEGTRCFWEMKSGRLSSVMRVQTPFTNGVPGAFIK